MDSFEKNEEERRNDFIYERFTITEGENTLTLLDYTHTKHIEENAISIICGDATFFIGSKDLLNLENWISFRVKLLRERYERMGKKYRHPNPSRMRSQGAF